MVWILDQYSAPTSSRAFLIPILKSRELWSNTKNCIQIFSVVFEITHTYEQTDAYRRLHLYVRIIYILLKNCNYILIMYNYINYYIIKFSLENKNNLLTIIFLTNITPFIWKLYIILNKSRESRMIPSTQFRNHLYRIIFRWLQII